METHGQGEFNDTNVLQYKDGLEPTTISVKGQVKSYIGAKQYIEIPTHEFTFSNYEEFKNLIWDHFKTHIEKKVVFDHGRFQDDYEVTINDMNDFICISIEGKNNRKMQFNSGTTARQFTLYKLVKMISKAGNNSLIVTVYRYSTNLSTVKMVNDYESWRTCRLEVPLANSADRPSMESTDRMVRELKSYHTNLKGLEIYWLRWASCILNQPNLSNSQKHEMAKNPPEDISADLAVHFSPVIPHDRSKARSRQIMDIRLSSLKRIQKDMEYLERFQQKEMQTLRNYKRQSLMRIKKVQEYIDLSIGALLDVYEGDLGTLDNIRLPTMQSQEFNHSNSELDFDPQ
ncbi:hypothetical protein HK103_003128 [Boothiomyces macroporosus]|uniref:Uncharacterized protein n=1 Tax=Boothiomyces macroporosus TaxID=261099 RepID=A0AAD5Y980_9FUNG|nr:hypothetical protein HK103_003128 [Boothiomyces macroporosus]